MLRRAFLRGVAGGLLSAVPAAQQASGPPLVGFLPLGSPSDAYDRSLVEAFQDGMREAGLVEHRDLVLEVVWTSSDLEVSRAVVRLVQRGAKLLIPVGTTASMAVKRQAPTTPILFVSVGNPLGIGLVESLGRPGGNVTGFGDFLAELASKYVQFALEVGRRQPVVYYLWHAGWTDGHYRFERTEQAAQSLNVKLRSRAIADVSEEGGRVGRRRPAEPVHVPRAGTADRVRHGARPGDDLRVPPGRRGRRADHVWPGLCGPQSPGRRLPRSDPPGHEAG